MRNYNLMIDAATEALRAWHIELFDHDPTDPDLLRRTATIAVDAALTVQERE